MAKIPLPSFDDSGTRENPFDRAEAADPWFLPDADTGDPIRSPLPRANHRPLIAAPEWAAAQATRAADLARLALLYGALEERLRSGPPGWRHRLALLEAAELSWAVGDRISAERLGLWEALRLSGVQGDAQGLARASWAVRRLAGGQAPIQPGSAGQGADLAAFLGRQRVPEQGLPEEVEDLGVLAAALAHLHPVTRAAALAQGWQMLGAGGATREIEAAVLASRLAADMGRGGAGAGFVPQAMSGAMLVQSGAAEARLAGFLRAAERATLAALMHLDRVRDWQIKAIRALADLQGRTPALLLAVLVEWPMVTSPLAEEITRTNKATVLRNLAVMQARGLVREVTGQGRYRVWTAKI